MDAQQRIKKVSEARRRKRINEVKFSRRPIKNRRKQTRMDRKENGENTRMVN